MPATVEEFFDYWFGLARLGGGHLYPALKWEYPDRQRPWIGKVLQIAAEKDFIMARGKGKPVQDNTELGAPVFVNCTMPTTERPKVAKFASASDKIWGLVEQLMLAGYKLSWSFDKSRGAYVASLTCKSADDTNYNKTLSAWSGGWYDALAAVLYKHYVYLSEDWALALTVKSEDAFG